MINHKHKFIFIHIPKCAGTSVERAFNGKDGWDNNNKLWKQHATIKQIKNFYTTPKQFNTYFKFTIIRNPFDRIVSSYHWLAPKVKAEINNNTFYDFVTRQGAFKYLLFDKEFYLKENRYHQIKSICDYILPIKHIDYIARLETLEKDWMYICDKLNININLPYIHKQRRKPYREYYNKITREIIEERYKTDLYLFNYKF